MRTIILRAILLMPQRRKKHLIVGCQHRGFGHSIRLLNSVDYMEGRRAAGARSIPSHLYTRALLLHDISTSKISRYHNRRYFVPWLLQIPASANLRPRYCTLWPKNVRLFIFQITLSKINNKILLKNDFVGISQGKVATVYRWGGRMYKLLMSNFIRI